VVVINIVNNSEIETGPVDKQWGDDSYYEKGQSTTTDKFLVIIDKIYLVLQYIVLVVLVVVVVLELKILIKIITKKKMWKKE
jgi:hypothetical protein